MPGGDEEQERAMAVEKLDLEERQLILEERKLDEQKYHYSAKLQCHKYSDYYGYLFIPGLRLTINNNTQVSRLANTSPRTEHSIT